MVAITGTAQERVQLSTDAANPQWQRGSGSRFYDIPGETGATFTPGYEEVGMQIRVRDSVTLETSAATSAVVEGPIVFDTFTESGTGTVSLEGHQADVGGTWNKHPSAVVGVNIDRDNDRAVGSVTSGNNFFVNQQQIPASSIRVSGRIYRASSGLNSVLLGFSNASPFDGYRIYFDTNITFTRYDSSSTANSVGSGVSFPRSNSTEQDFIITMETLPDRTRFSWKAPNTTIIGMRDDTHANRESSLNRYVGIGPRTNNYWDTFKVLEVDNAPLVTLDGMWTWYTDPRGVHHAGVDYIAYIDSAGSNWLTKRDAAGAETTVFVGIANSPIDDHNNPALCVLPGGKLWMGYSDHLDATGTRYKVTTNALPDISSLSSERTIALSAGATYASYVNPVLLSDGILRVIRRAGTTRYEIMSSPAADVEAGTETWSQETLVNVLQAYVKQSISPDGHRLYLMWGTEHPRDANISLYAAYLDVEDGTPSWHALDGTEITLPLTTSNCTLIRASSGGDTHWAYDMTVGEDNRPRFLATRYPGGSGSVSGILTNIEYWHYRWDGSAIVATQLAANQKSLYSGESYYAGGMCFDGNDPTIVFASILDSDGYYQIDELRVDEATNTITKVRNVSSRTLRDNCRPFSPKGHDGDVAVYWWRGTYNSYTSYLTEIHRASGSLPSEVEEPTGVSGSSAAAFGALGTVAAAVAPIVAASEVGFGALGGSAVTAIALQASSGGAFGGLATSAEASVRTAAVSSTSFGALATSAAALAHVKADSTSSFGSLGTSASAGIPITGTSGGSFGALATEAAAAVNDNVASSTAFGPLGTTAVGQISVRGISNVPFGAMLGTAAAAVDLKANSAGEFGALGTLAVADVVTGGIESDVGFGALHTQAIALVLASAASTTAFGALGTSSSGQVPVRGQTNGEFGSLATVAAGQVAARAAGSSSFGPLGTNATLSVLAADTIEAESSVGFGEILGSATGFVPVTGLTNGIFGALGTSATVKVEVRADSNQSFGALATSASAITDLNNQPAELSLRIAA